LDDPGRENVVLLLLHILAQMPHNSRVLNVFGRGIPFVNKHILTSFFSFQGAGRRIGLEAFAAVVYIPIING
jgi:hypothetical protein